MDRPLVKHAHAQCHVLLKVEGADTEFDVGGRCVPLTDESAVLINAWEHHSYVHRAGQPPTIILALYIEPTWLRAFRDNWEASAGPGFSPSGRRHHAADPPSGRRDRRGDGAGPRRRRST
ncbi:AraC family ligand binding domain-containing protein [Sulfitobacter profundi]|uniref:AraC family ligand binding domain-containing protein n=1 Tax=Sulfitobacter profundi TaxID=2679961 RepID=A0ABW1YWR5_9RHOB